LFVPLNSLQGGNEFFVRGWQDFGDVWGFGDFEMD
jgi:hypothetical protein